MNNSPRQGPAEQQKRAKPSSIRGAFKKIVFPALLAMKLGSAAAGCAATADSTQDDRMADVATTPDSRDGAMVNPDTGSMIVDAGTDAGSMAVDAGTDAGSMAVDAGPIVIPMPSDAGFESSDAGSMGTDGGPVVIPMPSDAGFGSSDAGSMGVDA